MRLVITTPTGIVVDNCGVASVRTEDASGSFGILDGHADFLTVLSVCVVSWREKNGVQGFCAVRRSRSMRPPQLAAPLQFCAF
jgi:F-type H+-transporting ATPase subunit epsilon